MADAPAGGDPVRTFHLLWGTRTRSGRGRRPALDAEQITAAAIGIADAEGLGELSMRRVAERIGAGTMSLYRHVPGKAELLDLMVDRVSAEVGYGPEPPRPWRPRLEQVARANRALLQRHPWLLELTARRPVQGPGVIAKYDAELRAVEGIGLSDVEMDSVLSLVLGHVRESAAEAAHWRELPRRTGQSDHQWWSALAPLLDQVLDPQRYPSAVRVGAAATEHYQGLYDPDHAFEFGLQRLLDGIEALVARRTGG